MIYQPEQSHSPNMRDVAAHNSYSKGPHDGYAPNYLDSDNRQSNPVLKYKGIRCDNSNWVEGFYIEPSPTKRDPVRHGYIISPNDCHDISGGLGCLVKIVPNTLCLSMGEYDMRGKEIYTGDIVSYNNGEYVFEVCFGVCGGTDNSRNCGYNGFYFAAHDDNTKSIQKYGLRNDPHYWLYTGACEVIGNIYEGKR